MRSVIIYSLSAFLLFTVSSAAMAGNSKQEVRNKKNVVAFYNKAINDKDFAAAEKYIGATYIQHNPMAADGKEGLKHFLDFAKKNMASFHADIKRVFADGNYVILHVHATRNPEDRGMAVMDIFRLDDKGKVVEHWDVAQPIPPPDKTANKNGMF
jgi:predicted SnoaL-like aldol condensation-catalyzing enzyme